MGFVGGPCTLSPFLTCGEPAVPLAAACSEPAGGLCCCVLGNETDVLAVGVDVVLGCLVDAVTGLPRSEGGLCVALCARAASKSFCAAMVQRDWSTGGPAAS